MSTLVEAPVLAKPGRTKEPSGSSLVKRLSDPTVPAGLVIGIGLWEVLAAAIETSFFPRPSAIAARMWELIVTGEATPHLARSVGDLIVSFAFSAVVGVVVGVMMGSSKRIDAALYPFVSALLAAPIIVFAPVIFALFGLGRDTVRIIIIAHCVWVIISNVRDGVLSARRDHLEMAASFGADARQSALFVRVPSALPLSITGLEIGFGRAVKGMINGELFITITGLGGLIKKAGSVFDATTILAVVFLTIMVALVGVVLIRGLERRLITWTV